MDPLRALKLIGRNQPFDEAAVLQGLERKGAYQLDAFPQFNEAMAEVKEGGPIADAMFADMLQYYGAGNTPVPVPASRTPEPVEFLRDRMTSVKGLVGWDEYGNKRLIEPHDDLLFDLHTPYYGEAGDPEGGWSKFTRAMVKDIDNHIENYPNVPAKPKARLVERRKETKAEADKERLEEAMTGARRFREELSGVFGPEPPSWNAAPLTEESQNFTNEYVKYTIPSLPEEKRDDIDDFIILAALGSMLGGAGAKEATKEEPSESQPS